MQTLVESAVYLTIGLGVYATLIASLFWCRPVEPYRPKPDDEFPRNHFDWH